MVGYILASLFGIGAFVYMGYEGIVESPVVDFVFWGLILSGVVLHVLESFVCKPLCRQLSQFKWLLMKSFCCN